MYENFYTIESSSFCLQGQQARTRGSPFALVNGATAQDVLCIYVPDGVALEQPLHIVYIPTGSCLLVRQECGLPCSAPMLKDEHAGSAKY